MGHQSTREEIWDLYHQVYKLRRLLRSLLCGPEQVYKIMRDVVSSLKNCLWQRRGKQPRGCKDPEPADTPPSQGRAPQRMRQDILAKRELAEAREAHWWMLAAATALEERIERLSWSITRSRAAPTSPPEVTTDVGEGLGGRARDTVEPYQRTAQPLLPHIVLLSGVQRHWRIRRLS